MVNRNKGGENLPPFRNRHRVLGGRSVTQIQFVQWLLENGFKKIDNLYASNEHFFMRQNATHRFSYINGSDFFSKWHMNEFNYWRRLWKKRYSDVSIEDLEG